MCPARWIRSPSTTPAHPGVEILLGAGIQVQEGERQGFIDTSRCMGHQEVLEAAVKCILVISGGSLVVRLISEEI